MMKIGLSVLSTPEAQVHTLLRRLKTYGLECAAHEWQDDLTAMAWRAPKATLVNADCAMWAIMGAKAAFRRAETRYGLSLLALCVQSQRGRGFPIVVLQTDDEPFTAQELPTPLQNVTILPAADAGTAAKLVARAHGRSTFIAPPFHLDMVGDPRLGQWLEVRPTAEEWPGIIFGIDEGEIQFQAVGPAGALPATSTLHFPMQGLQIEAGGRTFSAWAVRNPITPESAYFVKLAGMPARLLFGPFSEESTAEMVIIDLQ
ncbi:hypothetical protein [Desulfatitalea alkaliphila]|uniref:Uncharacterized protein n=1 Tax=Desulfatitalea alkaliphila TaxID=2929485 RepID=A0AA41UJD3_9BACT|nr:hypothetical protein [Desulfatitalea alkaliphila]MCJ8501780.1 hypothetical protein [Desulfatitalea alkaliphila]